MRFNKINSWLLIIKNKWESSRMTYSRWNEKNVIQESYVQQNYPSKNEEEMVHSQISENQEFFTSWPALQEKQFGSSSNVKNKVPIWPSNSKPRYIVKRNKNICSHETCTWMFIATLFLIAKKWKDPKYLSTGGWVNKCTWQ